MGALMPRFPLYIPSKSRAATGLTAKALTSMGIPHRLVVEEQQVEEYARHYPRANLLVLDPAYQRAYDTLDDEGDSFSKGSGPARNFIWEHSIAEGHKYHWIMDDNIQLFARLHRNMRVPVGDGHAFHAMEEFALRYSNLAMCGPNYWMFALSRDKKAPFTMNTRIYSCNLIRNDVPFRWRGRYNEDTILSLDMLKAGWCTVLFNAFLQYKMTTMKMGGGNTEAFYAAKGTHPKSEMLVRAHPDVAKVAWRFGRVHHHVDYSGFQHPLRRRRDFDPATVEDRYRTKTVQRRKVKR